MLGSHHHHSLAQLPTPNHQEYRHCQRVTSYIERQIIASGGVIPFSQFMELVLYGCDLGYYNTESEKFGPSGDFVTAPELSPLFGQCIARQCQQILTTLKSNKPLTILELGAGSGKLAADILNGLQQRPTNYYILEISPALKARQQQYLKHKCPSYFNHIKWLDKLPSVPITGVVIANEVMDAMAVERFCFKNQKLTQYFVAIEDNQFVWKLLKATQPLQQSLQTIIPSIKYHYASYHGGYHSERSLVLPLWMKRLSAALENGVMLLFDYGYPCREYYHRERYSGTLACYYRQHCHDNPLILCGIQDISAHVDFTLIAKSAIEAGLTLAGFTPQGAFLLACGLKDYDVFTAVQKQAIKKMVLPGEMGEAVKVMALSKNYRLPLIGFQQQNRCHQL